MRQILCMSHGPLAKGMIETLSIIVGDLDNIDFRCAYVDGNNDVEMIIDDYLKESMGNETIVVTDIFGGSINNEWLRRLPDLSKVYLISGMNLSLLVDLYLKFQLVSSDQIEEIIDHAIQASSGSIKFCNQRLFSAADNLRSIMDASEYKNYLLGLIFYKYLSDKLLQQVVLLADESLEEYNEVEKQTKLYQELLADEDSREDLLATIVDTLGYEIEPNRLV